MNFTHDVSVLVIAAVGFALAAGPAAGAETRYAITDLGLLPGGSFSKANAISDTSIIVGEATAQGATTYTQSIVWKNGKMLDIGGLGVSGSSGQGVNAAGVVVGSTDIFSINAYRWQGGLQENLNDIGTFYSLGSAINTLGQITGTVDIAGNQRAFRWHNGQFTILPTLAGQNASAEGYGINEAGHVVGQSSVASGHPHPFLWNGSFITDLGTPGGASAIALDINDNNEIVGWGLNANGLTRGFRWRDGVMTTLGTLGGLFSHAESLNNNGIVVGSSYLPWPSTAVHAMKEIDGQMIDLNDEIAEDSGWVLIEANDINNLGEIVGTGSYLGSIRAFHLKPLPASADLNGDGLIDVDDLLNVISTWGCQGLCASDVTGDGAVSVDDLLVVLEQWSKA